MSHCRCGMLIRTGAVGERVCPNKCVNPDSAQTPRVGLSRGAEPETQPDGVPRTHELKTWPNYFAAIASRNKTFEARKNDRDFREGDVLTLREYDGFAGYSGRYATARISYVMNGATAGGTDFGIKDGYCVLALRDVQVFPHA